MTNANVKVQIFQDVSEVHKTACMNKLTRKKKKIFKIISDEQYRHMVGHYCHYLTIQIQYFMTNNKYCMMANNIK